ncbi:MAG: AIR synthase-related protein [bacterium]
MASRIEVKHVSPVRDARGEATGKVIESDLGIKVSGVETIDVYTIDKELSAEDLERCKDVIFADPITQEAAVDRPLGADFQWAIEVGFLPGVTDNVGRTGKEAIEDLLKTRFSEEEAVYTSIRYLLQGDLDREQVDTISGRLHNPLIERVQIKSYEEFKNDDGMDMVIPRVKLSASDEVKKVSLDLPDDELIKLGKEGIVDHVEEDGAEVRRGPLALGLPYLKTIRDYYYQKEGRDPNDIELESLAQTWSEHCKHTIFAARLDEIDSIFNTYIKAATREVREQKGDTDICVSVFKDNSGVIRFNEDWDLCYKVETHNSPSALDPYGGAITGIVGVNRDPMGTGQGARLVTNMYGFCFGDPFYEGEPLYRAKGKRDPVLHPKVIFEGVREGVEHGGNKSGIPTPWGFILFDDRYRGKPLVFVGTVGLIPRRLHGRGSHEKRARAGDMIVMAGGRVGKDGIHGATFSSEGLHEGSPASAVQIGDPITQKKMHDAQLELRDKGLYTSVTDNGAGGLSCSVGEMARECGGARVDLERVPIKYQGLFPYEVWISESQERMTYAVPPGHIREFQEIMRRHDVEATVIGQFTDSTRCRVYLHDNMIMDMDLDFLHDGLPQMELRSKPGRKLLPEPELEDKADYSEDLVDMVGRLNLCSREYVVRQYDHEVQGGSVIKPLVGVKSDVHQEATVTRPLLDSLAGVALASGIHPGYGDIDTYAMARCGIDTAIRNVTAVGADPDRIVLLDNFCWCSSDEPERLAQLKRAAQACYDTAISFGTPFISGKDSMFNDFKGFDGNDNPVKISVPPTLLISSLGIVPNVKDCVSMEPKCEGDLVYVIGMTRDEPGGSEYYAYVGEKEKGEKYIGWKVPKVEPESARIRYRKVFQAIREGLLASCASIGPGGLAYALARMAMAAECGLSLDLSALPRESHLPVHKMLFSESMSRMVVTINPENRRRFQEMFKNEPADMIGKVTGSGVLAARGPDGSMMLDAPVARLKESYKKTLDW